MTPYDVYMKATEAQKRLPELEPIIVCNAYWACKYALNVIKGRWSEAEPAIVKCQNNAYCYARDVIKERWPEAEENIMQSIAYAYLYARDVIKGRWMEAEPVIIKEEAYLSHYAIYVIKGRWPEAEKSISMSENKRYYVETFFNEQVITKDQVGPLVWERMNLPGYFAPASLFEDKVSLLDMVIE